MRGEVTAGLSAGYQEVSDNEDSLKARNMVGRLLLSSPIEANRLSRIGTLPGYAEGVNSAAGVRTPRLSSLPTGEPLRRMPAELANDLDAYLHVVTLAQYAETFALPTNNIQTVE